MLPDSEIALIERFADSLWMERGLSANTLAAYQSDLRAFAAWLIPRGGAGLQAARRSDLLAYLALLSQQGRKQQK